MSKRQYNCSAPLKNELEHDHYECARNYFRDFGTDSKSVEGCKSLFEDYDKIKLDVASDMKKTGEVDDAYISDTIDFNAKRAIEIIDIALNDHNQQTHEPTKSNKWRRA